MTSALEEKLFRSNARVAEVMEITREALCGRHRFGVDEVRKLRGVLSETEPILAEAASLRDSRPEIARQLEQ
jgi:hypothetical protein